MTGTLEFLSHLRAREIRVWEEGGRLRYRGPKEALTGELLSEMAQRKLDLLDFLRERDVARRSSPDLRAARSSREHIPLSFDQESQWILHRLNPESPAYHVPFSISLRGDLEIVALERSLDAVIQKHEILRTVFPEVEGEPRQSIAPHSTFRLPLIDLSACPEAERRRESDRLLAENALQPFDLTCETGFRVRLVRCNADQFLFLVNFHHIVTDDRSLNIFMREVAEGYASALSGACPAPRPLPLHYADFAIWQRERLRGEILEGLLAFWRDRLRGIPEDLGVPTDRPRPAISSSRGAEQRLHIPAPLTAALERLNLQAGGTFFMTLLAAFKLLLLRYSGREDMVVGVPLGGRGQVELEQVIGLFVNVLPVRTDLSKEPSFREALDRVRREVLAVHTHADLPFVKLVEEIHPERSLSQNPVFQTTVSITPEEEWADSLPGLEVEVRKPGGVARFDLSLQLWLRQEDIHGVLRYSTDLFDAPTIARMGGHLLSILENAAAAPERPSELLSPAEKHQLTVEWNDTVRERPQGCFQELFELQAKRTPAALAAVSPHGALTYAELSAASEKVAGRLRSLEIAPETPVGICLGACPEFLVAVLGVLKAGGAFLSLDPESPHDRLAYLLEDSRAFAVITERRWSGCLPKVGSPVLCLDEELRAWEVFHAPGCGAMDGRRLAYVLYTSGSTGRPKGVLVEHRSLASYLSWAGSVLLEEGRVGLPVTSSPGFDASFKQMFAPLLYGGTVRFAAGGAAGDPAKWLTSLREHAGTGLNCIPSLWELLLEEIEAGRMEGLRQQLSVLLLGGERLNTGMVERTLSCFPALKIWNVYGPTEVTANASCGQVGSGREVTIGRPIGNGRIHLLDARLAPVPLGAAGELYIGGSGLARGYLGRPDLTAERFVPDPFAASTGQPGDRLYKTGDLGRFLPDGRIAYLGRGDEQVKIRGYRIEPGEIEGALTRLPGVAQAAVVARQRGSGESWLVAYVVPRPTWELTGDRVRDLLRQELPDYMVPAVIVVLDELPLNVNGKVDRRALPAPDEASLATTGDRELLRTLTEQVIGGFWEDLLGLERVGRRTDFFDLGGHSLLATRLVSRVRETFGVALAIRDVFERRTVAALAAQVDELAAVSRGRRLPPIERISQDGDSVLSFAQQRLWFIDQLEPGRANYNIVLSVRLLGNLDLRAFSESLDEVMCRHQVLRARFVAVDGQPIQRIDPPRPLPVPCVDLGALPEPLRLDALRRLGATEVGRPFDLAQGSLLRIHVLRLAREEHAVLLVLHHIIADGWSIDLLIQEIGALYRASLSGEPLALPPLPVQYTDFAEWQRRWLQGEVLEAQLEHWRRVMAGAPPLLGLATDRPRPPVQTFRGGRRSLGFPQALAGTLGALSRRLGASPFMILCGAFQLLLGRCSGSEDLVVGTPVAGRDRIEIERLIGLFVNLLPLRTSLTGCRTTTELVARVRDVVLEAHLNQDLPFEKLVEELQPERSLGAPPLVQAVFALNLRQMAEPLPGLSLVPFELESEVSKFDLMLSLQQEGERLSGCMEHNPDLFDASTIERLAGQYRTLLENMLRDPQCPLELLAMLSEGESQQLLVEWNDTATKFPREESLPELFTAVAAAAPEAPAIVGEEGEEWSYRRLDEASSRLAHHLVALGVEPGARVGVAMERSGDLLVAVLAVVKAGGAYVPLNPGYPDERLAFMLEDTGAAVVLVHDRTKDRLAALERCSLSPGPGVRVVCLNRDRAAIDAQRSKPLHLDIPAESLAYIIYTSGSTGRPKGVAVPHRAIVRLVRDTDYVRLGPGDRTGHVANISFDAATYEIWGALLNGAAAVVIPREVVLAPEAFAEALRERRVTSMFLTSALFTRISREMPGAFAGMSELLVGGEAVDPVAARTVLADRPPRRLLNGYGPTESTTFAAWHPIREVPPEATSVPIGRPLANTTLVVLDPVQRLAPLGTAGELLIGGDGLAWGYWNRPELTAERFVPDPWGEGGRLYRTGDLVRRQSGGLIEYLGRLDHQVKIRGFRIEPGEIEAVLASHPAVKECAVLARRDDVPSGLGEIRLVVYVVGDSSRAPRSEDLRAWLKDRLPEYMVPAAFVSLPALPLTANGKLDRAALPAPDRARDSGLEQHVEPRTPIEKALAAIWTEMLGAGRVGLGDDFFALGGHSLLATRVRARVLEAFGVDLPLRSFFEAPTLEELAGRVDELSRDTDGDLISLLNQLEALSEKEVHTLLHTRETAEETESWSI
jgi:amino acid adenylation domain-containing protein